jgi:hypothetical protein
VSVPPPVAVETCVLCGTALTPAAERCGACDLWVAVDGPSERRPIPRNALVGMIAGIAVVWALTLAIAALVG